MKYTAGHMEIRSSSYGEPTHSNESGFCGNQSLEESFCWQIPPTLISIHKNSEQAVDYKYLPTNCILIFVNPGRVFETHTSKLEIVIPTAF